MDISRLKKVLAGFSVAAIALTQVSSVLAAYSDVPAGVWYEEAVTAFTDAGYLDAAQPRFRGSDTANRAEFVKLLVELNGGILSTAPAVPSFDDVKASAWYYGYMEEAGKESWVKGDGNCFGSHPCYARPGANISRAEAAALIVRGFGLESTGEAPQFVDNPAGQWYTQAIQIAADNCVLQGDGATGRVRPADNMNRAEMVVMLNRVDEGLVYGVDCGTGETPTPTTPAISSVTSISSTKVEVTFNVALDKAVAETVANWSVTSPSYTVSTATLTADKTVELVLADGLTTGKEYTVTASNLKTAAGATFSDSETFTGYTALPQGKGTLEVAVSSKNPQGDTVPQGANGVAMLSLDLTASCDDSVTIESLTILHEGFGAKSDITGVYATIDNARVSRKRTIDSSDQTVDVRFTTPLVVAACKSVMIDVVADFDSSLTAGSQHNFAAELASDFVSNAKSVTGNFPLRGNTFNVAAVTSGQVSIAYRTVSPNKVEVGNKNIVIGKFEVSADSTEDQTLYSMTLHQNGTVSDGDITNIRIRRSDGTVLTNAAAAFVSKFATVTFNPPFTVLEGDKIVLEVIADVVGGAAKTVQTDFDETSDIFAVGSLYGYGVNGQLYGSTVTTPTGTATSVTVDAGQFTVEINGPAQQTYTRDQSDAVLANVVFTTGGETVNVKHLYIAVQGNTVTGATLATHVANGTTYDSIHEVMDNVTLRNATTGRSIEGTRLTAAGTYGVNGGATTGTYQIYRFDDFTVNGKENWQLKVDFTDNGSTHSPRNGDQFKAIICGEPTQISSGTNATGCDFGALLTSASTSYQMELEGLSTGDKVHDVRPRGNITGNAQRIADASLTVGVRALSTTDTAVKNAKNIKLMRFEARAGEAKSILLTKTIFEAASGGTGGGTLKNGTNYTLWVDTDGDGTVDTILDKGKAASGTDSGGYTVTFDTITNGGFVIGKEQTVTFEVHADVAGALQSVTNLQLRFATGSTFVEAETVDRGSSLSGIKLNGSYILSATSADVTVTTTPSTTFALVAQGNLYVTKDTTPVRNRQLLAGALGDTILRLNFRSENEPIDVTNIQLSSSGGTAASVERLELYKEGSTSYFAIATANNCGTDDVVASHRAIAVTTFCANMQSQQLVIPRGTDVKVLVKPRLKNDEAGATSNNVVQLFISPENAMNNSTGSGAVRARGAESSNNLNGNDGGNDGEVIIGASANTASNAEFSGTKNISVLSKIASITNANPDANGTNVTAGIKDIGQFKISALPHTNSKNGLNKVTLSGVYFNVTATNVIIASSSLKFYNKANATTTITCSPVTTAANAAITTISGSFLVYCNNAAGTVNSAIDQGTDVTFVLQANISNPKVVGTNNSNVLVSIQDFASISNATFAYNTSHFRWEDADNAAATSGGPFTWVEYPDTTVSSTSYQS